MFPTDSDDSLTDELEPFFPAFQTFSKLIDGWPFPRFQTWNLRDEIGKINVPIAVTICNLVQWPNQTDHECSDRRIAPCDYHCPVFGQTRLAFVVGVERYHKSGLKDLEYAEDDARQVKMALESLGFKTLSVIGDQANLTRLNSEIDRFIMASKKLNKSDIAIVYFSGHGVQKLVKRKNSDGKTIEVEEPFFCPNDAVKSDVTTLLSLNTVLRQLEDSSGSDHNIILLDACRDSADKSGKGGIDGSTIRELSDKLALFFAAKSGRRSFVIQATGARHFHALPARRFERPSGRLRQRNYLPWFGKLRLKTSGKGTRQVCWRFRLPMHSAEFDGQSSGTIVLGKVGKVSPPKISSETEKSFINSLGMRLVRIEPGDFMMGNEDSVEELKKLCPPQPGYPYQDWFMEAANRHKVEISLPYYLGAHEVTVGQFRAFVEATGL